MGSQAIQAQWSLNESSNSVYGIARGLLQAATSDNVQPLAILACEQFGNTLAISQETLLKIERTVLPTPEPISLQFLKVKVGFSKHDCAVQLGSNQAGLRFLAIAAVLISCLPPFSCAQALMPMLEATTTNKQYLPTTRHLKDLMSSLEGRCRLAGFADVVYGYRSIINGVARARGLSVYEGEPQVPDSKTLTTLVDTFREINRVAELEIESVVIEVRDSAAWIAAFSKWSLETPPSVYLTDGTPVAPQPMSKVTIIVITSNDSTGRKSETRYIRARNIIRVTKRFKIESLQDLITESSGSFSLSRPTYRIKFETFSAQIQDMCGYYEWERKAIFAAVPLAIRIVFEKIQSTNGLELGSGETKPSPFPKIEKVFRTMSLVLGLPPDFPSETLASVKSFRDLQDVEAFFDCDLSSENPVKSFSTVDFLLETVLTLPWWSKDDGTQPGPLSEIDSHENTDKPPKTPTPESILELTHSLSFICHVILLLSLFDNVSDILFVPLRPHQVDLSLVPSYLLDLISATLIGKGHSGKIYASEIFADVCYLLLHYKDQSGDSAIMRSGQSDCFWFSALEAPLLSTCGYFSITSCPGRIIHGREFYDAVYNASAGDQFMVERASVKSYTLQSATHRPFSKFKCQWQVKLDQERLFAYLSVINEENIGKLYMSCSVLGALNSLVHVVCVNCEHPVESNIEQSRYVNMRIISDLGPLEYGSIYPMGGDRGLQMYCLGFMAHPEPLNDYPDLALRQEACFECCIKAREKYRFCTLIL
ncbi:hypothetical protein F4859DRAFT_119862 [Xylaria cf. heliscus]|nr:hypothetical protein F4859DRAFT_119862 [Xylaria cf. heliscus]